MGSRGWFFSIAIWTLVGAFQASTWALSPSIAARATPVRFLIVALCNAWVWALLTPAVLRLGGWMYRPREARVRRGLVVVAAGLACCAAVTLLAFTVHRWLIPAADGVAATRTAAQAVWAFVRWYGQQVVEYTAIVLVAIALEMRRDVHAREREAAQLESERAELRARAAQLQAQSAELQAQLAEARLSVLRARLNPHFLFNTLNAVSALVAKNPRGVRDMIALLSELLRHALSESAEQEIPLRDELRLMRLYLEILEIRYQGQLRTEIVAAADVQDALVPNLILQPLVENAMKHGIDRAGGHGAIEVRAERCGDALVLTVQDTGQGDTPAPPSRTSGVGLRLTRGRLAELYGAEQHVRLEPLPDGGMRASITLPFHTSDALRTVSTGAA